MKSPTRYAFESHDLEHWDLFENVSGEWVQYVDVIGWRDTLEVIKARLVSATIDDPLGIVRLIDKALREEPYGSK